MEFVDTTFIRSEIILITSFLASSYIYVIASKINIRLSKVLYILLSSIFISTFCSFLKTQNFQYFVIVYLSLTIASLAFMNKDSVYYAISNTILAIGISNCVEFISVIILGTVFYLLGFDDINLFTEICASLLQLVLCFLFMKIKRLRNGFVFLKAKHNFWITLLIAGPIIVFTCFLKQDLNSIMLTIIAIGITISLIGLLFGIHSAIKRHYRKKLKLRAEEYSEIELAEKNKEIKKLFDEISSLSSIIHLDNYLINEMETTLKNKNDETINNLLSLSKQRNELVNNKIINDKLLPSTGNADIDTILSDLYIKASSRGIDFNLNADCDINYLIHNIIELHDFEELIRCCITNSIVDIENNSDVGGKILITISNPNDVYEVTIIDNGLATENDINLISKTINKSNASVRTAEFDSKDSFTKSLTIRFDGQNNRHTSIFDNDKPEQ